MDVTEDELLGAACVRLLRVGRLVLVRGKAPSALAKILASEEAPVAESLPVPVPAKVPTPSPAKVPEPKLEEEKPEVVAPVIAESPAPSPEPKVEEPVILKENEIPALDDVGAIWTEDELFSLNADAQKVICRSRNLKVSGKEAARVARILAEQEGS
jgi:outer membrane biosynthesis protein TonB